MTGSQIVENLLETELILELVMALFTMPEMLGGKMSEEDAAGCCNAALEVLNQYLVKLKTGDQPTLTEETQRILRRIELRELGPSSH